MVVEISTNKNSCRILFIVSSFLISSVKAFDRVSPISIFFIKEYKIFETNIHYDFILPLTGYIIGKLKTWVLAFVSAFSFVKKH